MKRFEARLDDLTKILTYSIILSLAIGFFFIIREGVKINQPELFIAPAITTLLLVFVSLYRTTAYSLGEGNLIIHRPAGNKTYDFLQISSLELVTRKELGMGLRTFGSGGFFGYFGHFVYKNIGKVKLFATDRNKMLLIHFKDNSKIIISPDDTKGFIDAIDKLMKKKK